MERDNLEAKSWEMQGEVQNLVSLLVVKLTANCLLTLGILWQINATKRPKNSALAVDLDWERNAKPPPVITEEVSQSIEEIIMKRIADGQFDDVQKAPTLPSKAPREIKEMVLPLIAFYLFFLMIGYIICLWGNKCCNVKFSG